MRENRLFPVPNLFSDVPNPVEHEAGEDGEGLGNLDEAGEAEALIDTHHFQFLLTGIATLREKNIRKYVIAGLH
jgi:hypothetical protein